MPHPTNDLLRSFSDLPSGPHHFELLSVTPPRNLEEDLVLRAEVFVDRGLLVLDALDGFACDDRSPTSLAAISRAAEKIPFLNIPADAPERFARDIYGERNPTVLLKHATHDEPSGDDRATLRARAQGSKLPRSRSLKVSRRSGSLRKWRVRHTSPECGAHDGRTGRFRAITPRLESTSRNRPGLNMSALPPVRLTEAGHLA
jgi:hypothetical protein